MFAIEANMKHKSYSKRVWYGTITLLIIITQIVIDKMMGAEAEYFNAYATAQNLTQWIHGQVANNPMIYRQDKLGMWALPLATIVMVAGSFSLAVVLVQIFARVSFRAKERMA